MRRANQPLSNCNSMGKYHQEDSNPNETEKIYKTIINTLSPLSSFYYLFWKTSCHVDIALKSIKLEIDIGKRFFHTLSVNAFLNDFNYQQYQTIAIIV